MDHGFETWNSLGPSTHERKSELLRCSVQCDSDIKVAHLTIHLAVAECHFFFQIIAKKSSLKKRPEITRP